MEPACRASFRIRSCICRCDAEDLSESCAEHTGLKELVVGGAFQRRLFTTARSLYRLPKYDPPLRLRVESRFRLLHCCQLLVVDYNRLDWPVKGAMADRCHHRAALRCQDKQVYVAVRRVRAVSTTAEEDDPTGK